MVSNPDSRSSEWLWSSIGVIIVDFTRWAIRYFEGSRSTFHRKQASGGWSVVLNICPFQRASAASPSSTPTTWPTARAPLLDKRGEGGCILIKKKPYSVDTRRTNDRAGILLRATQSWRQRQRRLRQERECDDDFVLCVATVVPLAPAQHSDGCEGPFKDDQCEFHASNCSSVHITFRFSFSYAFSRLPSSRGGKHFTLSLASKCCLLNAYRIAIELDDPSRPFLQ